MCTTLDLAIPAILTPLAVLGSFKLLTWAMGGPRFLNTVEFASFVCLITSVLGATSIYDAVQSLLD